MNFLRTASVLVLLLVPAIASAQQRASSEISFQLLDGDGNGLPDVTIDIEGQFDKQKLVTNQLGESKVTLPRGEYSVKLSYRDQILGEESLTADEPQSQQYTLPLYPFRILVSATNGDLMDGAIATYTDSGGQPTTIELRNGEINGLGRKGDVQVSMTWNAQNVPIAKLSLPEQRSEIIELAIVPLQVNVVQKDTGVGFGPALVAAASDGKDFPAGTWTDHSGSVVLPVFSGDMVVQARWFDIRGTAKASAPGEATVELPLASKMIPGPLDNGPVEPYLAQLRQPDFQVWANGTPRSGIRLPLSAGKYDVTIFDQEKKPAFRGIATVSNDQPQADIRWEKAAAQSGELAERQLVWPKGIWTDPPGAAIQEADGWRSIEVGTTGSLGLLPPGMRVRVPDNELGHIYSTDNAAIDAKLGVIEIKLLETGRVKILSADNPSHSLVYNCKSLVCKIPAPPGKYLVYVPTAQLLKTPVTVNHGQPTYVYPKEL